MDKFLATLLKAGFFAWFSLFSVVVLIVCSFFAELEALGLIADYGAYTSPMESASVAALMVIFTAAVFFFVFAREYQWAPKSVFFDTLIRSVFWTWIAFTVVIVPLVWLGGGLLFDAPEEVKTDQFIYRAMSLGITTFVFINFWRRAYLGTWGEIASFVRVKWILRGV